MSFQETTSFKKIKEYAENRIRQELGKRQTELLDKLGEILSGTGTGFRNQGTGFRNYSSGSRIQIDIRSVAEPVHKQVDHRTQCLALVSGHRRCTRTQANRSEFCTKHSENSKQIDNFTERAEHLDENFDFVSLRSRKGRLHYVSPKEQLNEYYVPVNLVYIEKQAYLQDETGFLYQLDEQLSIVGQRKEDLVFWYS